MKIGLSVRTTSGMPRFAGAILSLGRLTGESHRSDYNGVVRASRSGVVTALPS